MKGMACWQGNFRKKLLWVESLWRFQFSYMQREKLWVWLVTGKVKVTETGSMGHRTEPWSEWGNLSPSLGWLCHQPPTMWSDSLDSVVPCLLLVVGGWIKSFFHALHFFHHIAFVSRPSPANTQAPCHLLGLYRNLAAPIFKLSTQAGTTGCLVSMGVLQGSSMWQLRSWLEVEFYSW